MYPYLISEFQDYAFKNSYHMTANNNCTFYLYFKHLHLKTHFHKKDNFNKVILCLLCNDNYLLLFISFFIIKNLLFIVSIITHLLFNISYCEIMFVNITYYKKKIN